MAGHTVAVIGNPNSGKTTLFNGLTGARQRVGNWPGVTVERKSGAYRFDGATVTVVDLPGVYTLGALPGMESLDEKIAQDYALSGEADVFVNVLDASNLERNLYLTAQLLELQVPMVVVLNMADRVAQGGATLHPDVLAQQVGCRVVSAIANREEGIDAIKAAVAATAAERAVPPARVAYAGDVEAAIAAISESIAEAARRHGVAERWLAVKLIEGDAAAIACLDGLVPPAAAERIAALEAETGEDADTLIADGRFTFAHEMARAVLGGGAVKRRGMSDAIDRVLLGRWLGLPAFLAIMYAMFTFTINIGGAFVDVFDQGAQALFVDGLGALLDGVGAPAWVSVLLANGLGGGIQVVATFIPIIGFLYLFMSVLEDSGYMARAAYLMDRYMRAIGLPGKAFVPLIVGFGCNVPAIMASRTLEQPRDRILSVMMAPFMSCGARLAVYALFAAAFFPVGGQNVVFALYLVGIAIAVATGFLLKHTLLKGETTPFVMELPPYNAPQLKGVLIHTWSRLRNFLFDAGQVIVAVVVVLSFFNSMGTDGSFGNEDSDRSVLSAVGRAAVPVFRPLGVQEDNWPATVGIFTGVFAKEVIVGTLDALYSKLDSQTAGGTEETPFALLPALAAAAATVPENLADLGSLLTDPLGLSGAESDARAVSDKTFGAMAARYDGAAGAFAYLLFILLYAPCVAAMGAINREVGPRWTGFAVAWTTGLAYLVSVSFYQAATFASHPGSSAAWLAVLAAVLAFVVAGLRWGGRNRAATHVAVSAGARAGRAAE